MSSKASQARKAKLEKVTEERDKVEFNRPHGLFLLTLANGFISLNQVRERLATMKKEAEAAEEGREETEERAEVKFSMPWELRSLCIPLLYQYFLGSC